MNRSDHLRMALVDLEESLSMYDEGTAEYESLLMEIEDAEAEYVQAVEDELDEIAGMFS